MKRVLLLLIAVLMIASVGTAGHISIYTDANGETCDFAPGFNPNVHIVEKFSPGSTGVRFKMDPGPSLVFGFNTPFVPVGNLTTDLSLAYGQCLNGSIVLGTVIMQLNGPSTMQIQAADGFPFILWTSCVFEELVGTGGIACVLTQQCYCGIAVESSTWGSVKALYR